MLVRVPCDVSADRGRCGHPSLVWKEEEIGQSTPIRLSYNTELCFNIGFSEMLVGGSKNNLRLYQASSFYTSRTLRSQDMYIKTQGNLFMVMEG